MPSRVPKLKSGFESVLTVGESSLDTRKPGIVQSLDSGNGVGSRMGGGRWRFGGGYGDR